MNISLRNDTFLGNSSKLPIFHTAEYRRDTLLLILASFIVVTTNGLVIVAFIIEKKLRYRPANVLICSQGFTDLVTGVVYIPTYVIERYYQKETVTPFMACYMLFLSLFNLLALSMDRYLALYKPFLHHRITDLKKTVKLLFLIWIVPLGLTLTPLAWWSEPENFKANAQRIFLCFMWLFMFMLVVAMTALYLCVTAKAKRTIRCKRQSIPHRSTNLATLARKELRVAHLFGLLLFFFVSAYLPVLYMNLCDLIGLIKYIPHELEIVSRYSLIFNSIVNPVLCIYLKKDYLQVIMEIFHINRNYLKQLRSQQSKTTMEVEFNESDEHHETATIATCPSQGTLSNGLGTITNGHAALSNNYQIDFIRNNPVLNRHRAFSNGHINSCSSDELKRMIETPSL